MGAFTASAGWTVASQIVPFDGTVHGVKLIEGVGAAISFIPFMGAVVWSIVTGGGETAGAAIG